MKVAVSLTCIESLATVDGQFVFKWTEVIKHTACSEIALHTSQKDLLPAGNPVSLAQDSLLLVSAAHFTRLFAYCTTLQHYLEQPIQQVNPPSMASDIIEYLQIVLSPVKYPSKINLDVAMIIIDIMMVN